ncbi:hypothetical protein DPMN_169147 [Dreissena polymorpha]|uniref:Uncharacterized protein n=1 Tax=Dreissena polymorpha TaxID=45954 RepID=A0A9D4J015_DREPO|nr:hypothetical protein DPMN_169147 [Dreissena polymorpha]
MVNYRTNVPCRRGNISPLGRTVWSPSFRLAAPIRAQLTRKPVVQLGTNLLHGIL